MGRYSLSRCAFPSDSTLLICLLVSAYFCFPLPSRLAWQAGRSSAGSRGVLGHRRCVRKHGQQSVGKESCLQIKGRLKKRGKSFQGVPIRQLPSSRPTSLQGFDAQKFPSLRAQLSVCCPYPSEQGNVALYRWGTEAQRSRVTCPRPQKESVVEHGSPKSQANT